MTATPFALRIPTELKDAAKSLTTIWFADAQLHPKFNGQFSPTSINESLVYLVRVGLRETLKLVQSELIEASHALECHQEIASYFLSHLDEEEAPPEKFAKGSKTRIYIEHKMEVDWVGNPPSRVNSMADLAFHQEHVSTLLVAKRTIEDALAINP